MNQLANRQFICFALLSIGILTLVISGGFEWEHYRKFVQWKEMAPGGSDKLLVFLNLWGKSVLFFAVPLIFGVATSLAGWRRVSYVGFTVLAMLVTFLILGDLKIHAMTGNHLSKYLGFVLNPSTWEWAGQENNVSLPVAKVVGVATLLTGITQAIAIWIAKRHSSRRKLVPLAIGMALLGISPIVSTRAMHSQVLASRLAGALPPSLSTIAAPIYQSDGLRPLERFLEETLSRTPAHLGAAQPADQTTRIESENPPHLLVIVLESFRHDVLNRDVMPEITEWSRTGMTCSRHYCGSNASHYGLFSLLYGRNPLLYDQTLQEGITPQACTTLRNSGYRNIYLSSGNHVAFQGMEHFINDQSFDEIHLDLRGDLSERDPRILDRISERLATADSPLFIFAFLMSTHHDYRYPKTHGRFQPAAESVDLLKDQQDNRDLILNRYRNAAYYLDDLIGSLLSSIDLDRTIVAITGDHGESIFDDGHMFHGTRLSEIQTRVPMVIAGPGIPRRKLRTATTHADLLPTVAHAISGQPTHIRNTTGKDLISGLRDDRALLIQAESFGKPARQMLVIDRNQRLILQITADRRSIRPLWSCDLLGQPVEAHLGAATLQQLGDAICAELRAFSDAEVVSQRQAIRR